MTVQFQEMDMGKRRISVIQINKKEPQCAQTCRVNALATNSINFGRFLFGELKTQEKGQGNRAGFSIAESKAS